MPSELLHKFFIAKTRKQNDKCASDAKKNLLFESPAYYGVEFRFLLFASRSARGSFVRVAAEKFAQERALIPFAPHAFVTQGQETPQQAAFAFGVPHDINGFHPYTVSSVDLSHPLVVPFLLFFPG